jgi:taurine dioxygenase
MSDDDLERFTLYFGPFGEDPFIEPIPGREHVIAVERAADETAPIFADVWHTDWSFQKTPPAGTCLFGITIPPVGGDTLFSNQHRVYEALPADLRDRLEGKQAIHSARRGYGKDGLYGEGDAEDRSMRILSSDDALATQLHPILRKHPETGRLGVYGCFGYIIGIDGMGEDDANALLVELYGWQDREEFRYRHVWAPNTLVMWDNRSVLHKSTGGYDGHARRLHRTTIGAR